ncbi:MAG: hypothetical protein PHG79_01815 [Methanosarcina sp.]|jgi:hypothetical protein|nr:hypothetical protein [Methanosarcina sp.]MDD3873395.1 hypothetical protein [Methanosarcina sp.]MDD4521853.1 hypothetical protein [Methanosarcina sp.]
MNRKALSRSDKASKTILGEIGAKKRNSYKTTEGVNILLGDPRKAVVKLSIPVIVALSVQTVYSLTDTFWVAGLGADAQDAVGFSFPFFLIQMAVTKPGTLRLRQDARGLHAFSTTHHKHQS